MEFLKLNNDDIERYIPIADQPDANVFMQQLTTGLVNSLHPVHSLFWTSDPNFDPNITFGGIWKRIEDKFIFAAKLNSSFTGGGCSCITLSTCQLPSHDHEYQQITKNYSYSWVKPEDPAISESSSSSGMGYGSSGGYGGAGSTMTSHYCDTGYRNVVCKEDLTFKFDTASYNMSIPSYDHYCICCSWGWGNVDGESGGGSCCWDCYLNYSVSGPTITYSSRPMFGSVKSTGDGCSINIMPPYETKYCWERIS